MKKMHETILGIALEFEEAKEYLKKLGYQEENTFEENMEKMKSGYERIKSI